MKKTFRYKKSSMVVDLEKVPMAWYRDTFDMFNDLIKKYDDLDKKRMIQPISKRECVCDFFRRRLKWRITGNKKS